MKLFIVIFCYHRLSSDIHAKIIKADSYEEAVTKFNELKKDTYIIAVEQEFFHV